MGKAKSQSIIIAIESRRFNFSASNMRFECTRFL